MEKLTLNIKQPEFCKSLGEEMWQYLVHDLKNDKKFKDLCRRYYEVVARYEFNMTIAENIETEEKLRAAKLWAAKKEYRHAAEIEKSIHRRADEFARYWISKYGKAELNLKEMFTILEGNELEVFTLRLATTLFLSDFIEDCLVEMNACIRKFLPDAKYEALKDFLEMEKRVSAYAREILDSKDPGYQDLFDEHSASIKMTIYNKVNGFLNADKERELKEKNAKRQLEFDFKDYDD